MRNLDPSGDLPLHSTRWVSLANEMNTLFVKSGATMPVRDRLFAADTQMRVYRASRNPDYTTRAKAIVDSILSMSSSTPEYADALIIRGDIGVAQGESPDGLVTFYRRAGQLNPRRASVAERRVQSLANGTFLRFLPSDDVETPRIVATAKAPRRAVTKRIILDPGHGGFDSGAVNGHGLLEKDVTLDIARRVKATLERNSSIAVHLTREEDVFVPLARRTAYANKKQGDAFVSLHLNASPSHSARGLETYYLDTTDDEASRLLAERENGVVPGGEVDDLTFILSDLIQSGKLEESVELSHALQGAVYQASRPVYREAKSHGVKKGPFFVLVGAHMPCTLIELFFIDNPHDGAKLATEPFRSIVSEGLAQGLTRFALGTALSIEAPVERAQLRVEKLPKRGGRSRPSKKKK